jgi:hypothetical protein
VRFTIRKSSNVALALVSDKALIAALTRDEATYLGMLPPSDASYGLLKLSQLLHH